MREGRPRPRASRWAVPVLGAAWLAGCGLDWSIQAGGDGGSSSSSGGSSGGGDGGTSGNAGATCRTNAECPLGAFCHFDDHFCGRGAPGHCSAPQTGCTGTSDPVCTCDGIGNANACAANGRGQDTSVDAPCPTPGATYRCGDVYCLNGQPLVQEFCIRHGGTVTPTYSCDLTTSFACVEDWCSDAGCNFGGCACSAIDGGSMLDCP